MGKRISDETNAYSLFKFTWINLSKKSHFQIKLLLFIIFLSSFAEVISITALLPYLAVIISPESLLENKSITYIGDIFGITEVEDFILPLTFVFLIATVSSGVIRYLSTFYTLRVSSNIGSDLSINAFKSSLNRSYSYHLSKNSNILITTITNDIGEIIYFIVNPLFNLVSAIFISLSIVITLLVINLSISLTTIIIISTVYLLFVKFTSNTIKKISKRNIFYSQSITKLVQESLGGIRDIILSNNQNYYLNKFEYNDRIYRKQESFGYFINLVPRLIIEPLAIVLVASFGFILINTNNTQNVIPILGSLTFSAVRLLPFAQRIYEGITLPKIAKSKLVNLLRILENPSIEKKIEFKNKKLLILKNKIELKSVSYTYNSKDPFIIRNLNLSINSGEKIGITGTTGSGKSTLIDLIMGLIKPSSGDIFIDDKNLFGSKSSRFQQTWQNSIMHVPQTIFLTDASIAENIAFGVNKSDIDYEKILKVAKKSQILDFIEKTNNGIHTYVGEKGVRLSGGQRQRIGIARALYKGSKIILLDEATSALDNKTEKLVMQSFNDLGTEVTIIIVTHRLNTLIDCQRVFELKDGKLKEKDII